MDKKERIKSLNDEFRKSGKGGLILQSEMVSLLSQFEWYRLYELISESEDFEEAGDMLNVHESGYVSFNGDEYIWKIDYFSKDFKSASEDPSDEGITARVMTIMHEYEY